LAWITRESIKISPGDFTLKEISMFLKNNLWLLISILLVALSGAIYLSAKNRNFNSVYIKKVFDTTTPAPVSNKTVLIATGDVIPTRSVNYMIQKNKNPVWPFEKTKDLLKSADITLINLETPLIKNCPVTNEGFKFCGDAKNVEGLVVAGVDVASIANNHFSNYGAEGETETKVLLTSNNIKYAGEGNIAYQKVNDTTFAFLSYNDTGTKVDEEVMKTEIGESRKKADVVVVSFHWGIEYTAEPSQRQIYLAHLAIDDGADLIIGNHPHWVQSSEWYKGKFIKYAHGNFVFDQMWSEETKKGVIGKYTFEKNKLVSEEFIPVYITDYGQPSITVL
jgi:poly-gamma-glutamate synthesis protein (capsule biosynthesis protein)